MPAAEQLAVLIAAMEGLFDDLPEEQLSDAMSRIRAAARKHFQFIDERISENKALSQDDRAQIIATARTVLPANHAGPTPEADEVKHGPDA